MNCETKYKRHCSFLLALSWITFSGEASYQVMKALQQPYKEVRKGEELNLLQSAE